MLESKIKPHECEDFNTVVKEGGLLWHTGLEKYTMIYDVLPLFDSCRIRKINYCPFCGKEL